LHRPAASPVRLASPCWRLAFKMASDALRWWFGSRFGGRNEYGAQASVGGKQQAPNGSQPLKSVVLFEGD